MDQIIHTTALVYHHSPPYSVKVMFTAWLLFTSAHAKRWAAEHGYIDHIPDFVKYMADRGFHKPDLVATPWFTMDFRAFLWHRSIYMEPREGGMRVDAKFYGSKIPVNVGWDQLIRAREFRAKISVTIQDASSYNLKKRTMKALICVCMLSLRSRKSKIKYQRSSQVKILWKVFLAVSGTNENLSLSNLPGTTAESRASSGFADQFCPTFPSLLLRPWCALPLGTSRCIGTLVTPCTAPSP